MMVKVTVKYDGSNYFGWQTQNGKKKFETVGNVINKAVSTINKRATEVVASGRTDRGVHAIGQVFHFKNDHKIPVDRLLNALNNALPKDIEVIEIVEVDNDFHARFSAISKEYHYYLNTGKFDIFKKNYINQYNKTLNHDLMLEAAKMLVGTHDFTAFNATNKLEKSNQIRTISKINIIKNGDLFIFEIEGNSFLRHMVRMIVGMLVYIGAKKYTINDLEKLLKNEEVEFAPFNIAANGLYLFKVNY